MSMFYFFFLAIMEFCLSKLNKLNINVIFIHVTISRYCSDDVNGIV